MMAIAGMNARERIIASVRHEEVDRFPVWLKMANDTWRSGQPESVRALDDLALLAAAGCDTVVGNGVSAALSRPHVSLERSARCGRTVVTYVTPDGELVEEIGHDPYT